jgi:lysophospholipase L1-like esterase
MELHPVLRGLSPVAMHTTNRWGLRGDEPPLQNWKDTATIVAIGGSTTLCFYLDDHKTWPYLVQEKLRTAGFNAWVGNGGLDGQSTRAHIVFMEKVIPKIRPKAVIFLTGINDLGFSITESVRVLGNKFDREQIWNQNAKAILFRSRVAQLVYVWKQILWDKVEVVTANPHHDYLPRPLGADPGPMPADVRPLLPGLPEYRDNLKKLIALARASGARPIFMTQPLLFETTPYWEKMDGGIYWMRKVRSKVSAAMMRKFLDAYNQELLTVCAEEKVDCLDLARLIPSTPKFYYDTMHFTEVGNQLVSDLVARFLQKAVPDLLVPMVPTGKNS